MAKQNKKVFVVDDDRFHLEMMDQILKNNGFEDISLYTNGVDALKDIHLNPTVVFLDHQMDELQGFEILRKMKRSNPNIFVVMVSAQEEIQVAVSSLKYGAIDYLQKDMALESNIKDVLERIEKLREVLRAKKPSLLKSILNVL
jgi:DNA-binding NtrC family response regulator